MNNIDFKSIAKAILNQKAIVFIGQELSLAYGKKNRLNEIYSEIIAQSSQQYFITYKENDPFLNVESGAGLTYVRKKMEEFYEAVTPNPILEKLAKIPFHVYISTSPDLALEKQFLECKIPFEEKYFNAINYISVSENVSCDNPLIYHIFGHVKDRQTYIQSYSDVFRYLKALNSENLMPVELKNRLGKNADHIIFLGMDFNQWQYHMLLNILEIDTAACANFSMAEQQPENYFKSLHDIHFKITYIPEGVEQFVENLYRAIPDEALRVPEKMEKLNKKYNAKRIREFLINAYNPIDFETLCLCNFEEVYKEFVPTMPQANRVNLLLGYVLRTNSYEVLLQEGKEYNQVMYDRFQPFFE